MTRSNDHAARTSFDVLGSRHDADLKRSLKRLSRAREPVRIAVIRRTGRFTLVVANLEDESSWVGTWLEPPVASVTKTKSAAGLGSPTTVAASLFVVHVKLHSRRFTRPQHETSLNWPRLGRHSLRQPVHKKRTSMWSGSRRSERQGLKIPSMDGSEAVPSRAPGP